MTCAEWLKLRLTGEEFVWCDLIREEAKQRGYTRGALRAARKLLGVKTCSDWACWEDGAKNWYWYLEEE